VGACRLGRDPGLLRLQRDRDDHPRQHDAGGQGQQGKDVGIELFWHAYRFSLILIHLNGFAGARIPMGGILVADPPARASRNTSFLVSVVFLESH
jgi:hypothetical protein